MTLTPSLYYDSLLHNGTKLAPELVDFRRDLHRFPELSFEESRTAAHVAAELRKLGLDAKTGVGGHGVVADIAGTLAASDRIIALRADMDALPIMEDTGLAFASERPGVMHACGHDAHTTMLLGAAKLLMEHRDRFAGKIRLIFQSAEEIVAGAKAMIAEGVLEGVDEIYGLHNLPTLSAGKAATRTGTMMGSVDRIEIKVEGKGGHGAMPDQTIDPIVAAAALVGALQTAVSREISPFSPVVVTIGSIHAGETNNVIPMHAELTGTVRTFHPDVQRTMEARLRRIVEQTCESYRCRGILNYIVQVPPLVNEDACTRHTEATIDRMIGPDNRTSAAPTLGGEDFAVYLNEIPGCFFWLGSGPEVDAESAFGLHHPRFQINEKCLPLGSSLLAGIAMDRLGAEQSE